MIKAILACDENWGIGKAGTLPWPHNSADLKWFKQMTTGNTVVMGRKTWDSLPVKPLPNRKNIVVSSNRVEGADITIGNINGPVRFSTVRLPMLKPVGDIWLIGGATLIESCMDTIDEFWLNRVQGDYDCDVFLPRELIMDQFVQSDVAQPNTELNITRWIRK